MNDTSPSTKVKSWHLDRRAVVYVRQSMPQQVHDHQESTSRQYALVDRAGTLAHLQHHNLASPVVART